MISATDGGRLSGRATPSLQDGHHRKSNETGGRSTYLLPIAVQTNRATSHCWAAAAMLSDELATSTVPATAAVLGGAP